MKHSEAFKTVPMPAAIARLPKDVRGYPIPYSALITNGKPDFAAIDPDHWVTAFKARLCGVCGMIMQGSVYFIGGPLCAVNRMFFDHPMHEECAVYALKVCPFLAISRMTYRAKHPEEYDTIKAVSTSRNGFAMLGKAQHYEVVVFNGEPLLKASMWEELVWWRDGATCDYTPGEQP